VRTRALTDERDVADLILERHHVAPSDLVQAQRSSAELARHAALVAAGEDVKQARLPHVFDEQRAELFDPATDGGDDPHGLADVLREHAVVEPQVLECARLKDELLETLLGLAVDRHFG